MVPPDTALKFDGVSMQYANGTQALDQVDLTLRHAEFVSIVGPSGCGKSTMLRLAAGLDTHNSGTISVDRATLGYTFQEPTLLPWRRVLDNVALLPELRGLPRSQAQALAQARINLVGLAGFERHYPRQLSGGMRMRASLARALTLDPKVFLFDEPFAALDEITRGQMLDELSRIWQERRFAGLFITHSIPEAVWLSHRVLVMSRRPGRIIAEFQVPFDWPRTPELHWTPEFTALAGEISAALRQAIEGKP